MKIKINQTTALLSKIFEEKIKIESTSWVKSAFDSMLEFKANYEIEQCSTEEETDELLAEYGTNSWNSEGKPKFQFSLTRQIRLEGEEEFNQLKIKLMYDPIGFEGVESMNFWAMDFDNALEWRSAIEKTDGYLKIAESTGVNYEISIDAT